MSSRSDKAASCALLPVVSNSSRAITVRLWRIFVLILLHAKAHDRQSGEPLVAGIMFVEFSFLMVSSATLSGRSQQVLPLVMRTFPESRKCDPFTLLSAWNSLKCPHESCVGITFVRS